MQDFRVGFGYDSHRFVENFPGCKPLVIAGGEIPFTRHFEAHSDGDVVYHALTDAILGALALPDIGHHFPNTDPNIKGINSGIILYSVLQMLMIDGYRLNNVDITIVIERPKMAPYIAEMKKNIASVCKIAENKISVKAKTNEQLDAVGAGLGAAVHAVVSVVL